MNDWDGMGRGLGKIFHFSECFSVYVSCAVIYPPSISLCLLGAEGAGTKLQLSFYS